MNELPECLNIAGQLNKTSNNKKIITVISGYTPHKLVGYFGKPPEYQTCWQARISGKPMLMEVWWK